MFFKRIFCLMLTGALFALVSVPAQAGFVSVNTSQSQFLGGSNNSGWWTSTSSGANNNSNYITGSGFNGFFTFDLSAVSGNVTGATLRIKRFQQSVPVVLSLWDVTTPASVVNFNGGSNNAVFVDLGSGINYGQFTVAPGASADILSLNLNSAALLDINNATAFFTIGTSATLNTIFGSSNQLSGNTVYLDLEIGEIVESEKIPEPASMALLVIGLGGLFGVRRRISKRKIT